nr:protein phosphatase 2C domain-containing protein [Caballeronia sp. Sq4a]
MPRTFSCSNKGPRSENQDSFCVESVEGRFILAVADGVGGNKGGEVASRYTIATLLEGVHAGRSLLDTVDAAHSGLLNKADQSPELDGMATTLTAVICDSTLISGVHCGDSRAYVLRGNGLKQLTEDHTEVARLYAEGKLTKEEALHYPRKNVLSSAVGTHRELIKQSFTFNIERGDRLLLMTDGVYEAFSKREIQARSAEEGDFDNFCRRLMLELEERGATDNFTLVGIEFD